MSTISIRPIEPPDRVAVQAVERAAFGEDDEARLVAGLDADPTASPRLSLLARSGERPVGHVLFTAAGLDGADPAPVARILGPLAVVPDAQRQGVGTALVEAGLERLARDGVDLVFVFGPPSYYPRFGFRPALPLGLTAPYPLAEYQAAAWMVLGLSDVAPAERPGRVRCAAAFDRPEYWRE